MPHPVAIAEGRGPCAVARVPIASAIATAAAAVVAVVAVGRVGPAAVVWGDAFGYWMQKHRSHPSTNEL